MSSATNLDEDGEVKKEDPFSMLIRQITEEHSNQLHEMRNENEALKKQLNIVLQATWSMGDDGWSGGIPSELASLKLLTVEKFGNEKKKRMGHNVPEEFDNPQRKDRTPKFFELRERWCVSKSQLHELQTRSSSEIARLEDVTAADEEIDEPGGFCRQSTPAGYYEAAAAEARRGAGEMDGIPEGDAAPSGCCPRALLHPGSTRLIAWDITGMLLLVFDLIMVPISAFNPTATVFTDFMEWLTLVFWTCDMFVACFTGYTHKGSTIMNQKLIVLNYLRSWFWLDIVIVAPDWVFTIMGMLAEESAGSNATKLLRAFRLVRGLRLLRLAKLRRMIVVVKDHIESESVFKVVNVALTCTGLLFATHLLGALWYALGTIEMDSDSENWITTARIVKDDLHYRYLTSLHWAVSHFTLGNTNIYPQNSYERIFATCMLVMGMTFMATFTSYITVAMLTLKDSKSDTSREMWLLRRYLRQHKVSPMLQYRVLRYSEFHSQKVQVLSDDQINLIAALSDALRTELRFFSSFATFLLHPLIDKAISVSQTTIQSLANTALSHKVYALNDVVFKPGLWDSYLYVVETGSFTYRHKVLKSSSSRVCVNEGDWACEPALWVPWMTQGKLVAIADCKMVVCDAEAFGETLKQDGALLAVSAGYAKRFAEWINEVAINPAELTDVTVGEKGRTQARKFLIDSFPELAMSPKSGRRSMFQRNGTGPLI